MGETKKRPSKQKAQQEWDVIFPFRDVELQSGEKVVVRQWDIDTGAVLTGRVAGLLQKLRGAGLGGEVELDDMLRVAKDECFEIVRVTIGWTVDELKARANWEDFLSLLQAVIDTSLIREDGGGALPKIVELAGALNPLVAPRSASAKPSTSSSQPGTP